MEASLETWVGNSLPQYIQTLERATRTFQAKVACTTALR
jgi:hypothetical protein